MKTAFRTKYGSEEVLSIQELEIPKPKDNEVLIRVYASTVNRTDCAMLWGKPFIMRLFTGLFKPKTSIPGTDFAGQIESVGKNVKSFKISDKVFGFNDLGLQSKAEYMVFPENGAMSIIPDNITFAQAAASLEGAHYTINMINKVTLKAGDKVLINGATGGIGSALLQFLKYYKTQVTAVCDTKNIELIKSLGADRIYDYTREDFTQDTEKYDFIFDAVGKSTFAKCKPLLKEEGIYISSELGPMAENIFLPLTTKIKGGKRVIFPVPSDIPKSIHLIKKRMSERNFKPVIGRQYPLTAIADAYQYVASGQKTGNVIISIS